MCYICSGDHGGAGRDEEGLIILSESLFFFFF